VEEQFGGVVKIMRKEDNAVYNDFISANAPCTVRSCRMTQDVGYRYRFMEEEAGSRIS